MSRTGLSAYTTYHLVFSWSDETDEMSCWLNGVEERVTGIAWDMEDTSDDGVLYGVGTNMGSSCTVGGQPMAAYNDVPSSTLNGWVDEVSIWYRALSAGEVENHYTRVRDVGRENPLRLTTGFQPRVSRTLQSYIP